MNRLIAAALIAAPLLVTSSLVAQEAPPADEARAEELFEEGRRALEAEDYRAACAKFEESQRLDPGAGTLMNLGTCAEQLGQDTVALTHFREALAMLPPGDDRIQYAEARVAELEAKLVVLEADNEQEPAPPRQAKPSLPPPDAEPPLLGWTLVGVGAAGVVSGITTSILIAREQDLVAAHCEDMLCDETGFDAAERGKTLVWVNAAAYGVGAVALGAGVGLILSHDGKEKPESAPTLRANVGVGKAMINYGGRF